MVRVVGEGGGVGDGGGWELQQRHGRLWNDNEAISRASKCLILWWISIVGGAFEQQEATEKKGTDYSMSYFLAHRVQHSLIVVMTASVVNARLRAFRKSFCIQDEKLYEYALEGIQTYEADLYQARGYILTPHRGSKCYRAGLPGGLVSLYSNSTIYTVEKNFWFLSYITIVVNFGGYILLWSIMYLEKILTKKSQLTAANA